MIPSRMTWLRWSFHFDKTHPTIPRNIQFIVITVSVINTLLQSVVYRGICTPAFSQAWINAVPCSTLTFFPSMVISISPRLTVDAENWRDRRIHAPRCDCRWAEMTARRRNISSVGPSKATWLAVGSVNLGLNSDQSLGGLRNEMGQSWRGKSKQHNERSP